MSTLRRRAGRLVAALIAPLAMGSAAAASSAPAPAASAADAGDYSGDLTFDWPIACPATVALQFARSDVPVVDAEFTVELVEGGAPGNLLLKFGPAQVTAVDGPDGFAELATPVESPLLTNPTVEIDRAGAVVAVGYEEWEESQADPGTDIADTVTIIPIGWRVNIAAWGTWVDAWAMLGTIDGAAEATIELGVDEWSRALDLTALAEQHRDGLVELYASAATGESGSRLDFSAVVDPSTLQPQAARSDHFVAGRAVAVETFVWTFDWSACDHAATVSELPPPTTPPTTSAPATTVASTTPAITAVTVPGFRTIHVDDLPFAALDTLDLIASGGPFPYRQDDSLFGNREGVLPRQPDGYYREYTVETPGLDHRGARRIVAGDGGELFYTDDHYDSFRVIVF